MGGCEPGFQADDEIPILLSDWSRRTRRDSIDGFCGPGQHQDAGGKVVHVAPHTSSKITSKSISRGGGRSSYRGLLKVYKGATDVKSNVVCDALLLDDKARSDTYPYIEIDEEDVTIGHEASVSKVGEEQLFYLMSRGLSEEASDDDGRIWFY